MVAGFGERERQAAEQRRQDLLAEVARERLMPASLPIKRPRVVMTARHGLGAFLVGFGRRLQGADLVQVGGEPAVALPILR